MGDGPTSSSVGTPGTGVAPPLSTDPSDLREALSLPCESLTQLPYSPDIYGGTSMPRVCLSGAGLGKLSKGYLHGDLQTYRSVPLRSE